MPFQIPIVYVKETYRMLVTQKYESDDSERFEVRAKNHTFLIDCNRPALVKKKLEHIPWEWNLVAGKCPGWFFEEDAAGNKTDD